VGYDPDNGVSSPSDHGCRVKEVWVATQAADHFRCPSRWSVRRDRHVPGISCRDFRLRVHRI